MLGKIKQKICDMGTVKTLCLEAEKYANANGQKEPGAEHFFLAALALPDGTARKAFERIHIDPNGFQAAINQQYQDALRNVGIEPHFAFSQDTVAVLPSTGVYKAQFSAQSLMQELARQRKAEPGMPLLSAHVIMALGSAQYGIAMRALKVMGVDMQMLIESAAAEIKLIYKA
ncbi:Clp protease N-terminal domain-containing protein [Janthinobacterium sp. B9-8]|uniref:Clp protease N-terminal domain-containing protein n=1 Tax=Janthinobacterium sp. B9-8 TaxID=1236179 RepID=UPI00061CF84A|nr:Clp protease N-terminal domain-containing protein [Janthinobacterium sp. B9-8]AMC36828.1 hypothetical protein VN23_20660 [Janthinobacterium sp. B9-8]